MSGAPEFPTPHRRFNPLTGSWVLVSAHRTERPWLGETENVTDEPRLQRDPACYLCPGSTRANGAQNPDYTDTFVFTNDYPALLPEPEPKSDEASPLFRAERQAGTCRVICFSPRHDLTLAELDSEGLLRVIDLWADQTAELGQDYRWVQVFENKGEAMGASNPHPHGQIWAGTSLPSLIEAEDRAQEEYAATHGGPMLLDYARAEHEEATRVVCENEEWIVVVPYWAVWPFETLIIPRRPARRMPDLDDDQRRGLAGALQSLLSRYDGIFDTPFPYSMGWHGAPFQDGPTDHWQLHAHAYPPLLRSATVRKFMVGYELLAESQRDLTPEAAAARLRDMSETRDG
ncbi:MAG: UDP-glucose--hexose-1-phosphate uridylyltransferase [Acidimicrobiia bacterium]|nr:UDP-glucose--hexose-1-phosphate uridylyltransferase [Acidimicrobiia bacterium]MBT8192701.1 UDP-glucose--hexose-1-phosphate uridylyltransferase [Acidimicrobiia bacterium]NNF89038.1 UDP-glucose--hexose-1-phosphate uridylyltransferase [Acidimicrobiia bacterium]NNL14872.1 UDP-glucose--hexose-1-phosphate uridylyltransferase [Acidimicrobiia bacterium]NNL96769.1 UDP-glucose--hexose-1-phosphate uridylyltransferase [Acidimicrobiia bacterium]